MAERDEKLVVNTVPIGSPLNDNMHSNSASRNDYTEGDRADDNTYVSTADFSQEMRYTEELSTSILEGRLSSLVIEETSRPKSPTTPIPRSLPSSATLEQPLKTYQKGEWVRPKTVSRAEEKRKLLQRKFLMDVRKNNNNHNDMKWNQTSPMTNNNELFVPLRVADTMPIKSTHNTKLIVKKTSRGGGDVLGGSRGKQSVGTYSFLTENSNLLAEGLI